MKTAVYFKHFLSAFAALTLVCIVSSCKDQDFNWDAAHANSPEKKFTNAFIEAFGKPAENHEWGFDLPWLNSPEGTRAMTKDEIDTGGTGRIKKVQYENVPAVEYYGQVPNITERENWEVFEWFSTHKVEWENTTHRDTNGNVVKVRFNENTKESTRNVNATVAQKVGDLSTNNSLKDYTDSYWLGSPTVGVTFNFTHAWVQNVACDPLRRASGDPEVTPVRMPDDVEIAFNGSEVTNNGMNQLIFHKSSASSTFPDADTNDFNNGDNGWGYGRQPDITLKNEAAGEYRVYRQNGVLICGAEFNNASVKVSVDEGARHDKWIIVYLKGVDYEGWYLGFDLEGGGQNGNEQIPANGYCNDWIVKLSAVGGPGYEPWSARVMCEDLGGEDNTVDLGGGASMISDIDYNDIVIDIDKATDVNNVEITLQAAGGTLPLILSYKLNDGTEVPLFETHELFSTSHHIYYGNNHTIDPAGYRIMYNTGADNGGGRSSTQKITLVFGASQRSVSGTTFYIDEPLPTGSNTSEAFKAFMDKLQIKVYRRTTVDYIGNPDNLTSAEWQTIGNYKDSAPLMICVPKTTKWLKERNSIKLGYGGFPTWVQNPEKYFWIPPGINEQFLYNL